MVDFNSDSTVTTPALDIVRVLILQRHNDLLDSLEAYNKLDYSNVKASNHIIRSRLVSLFLMVQASLKRKIDPKEYERIKALIISDDMGDITEAIYFFNEWLDRIGLTRIDLRKEYDRQNIEEENKAYGL